LTGGPAYPDRFQRLAAYAVCVEDGRVLLVRLSALTTVPRRWTLPGGGIDHGEDPVDGALRELEEETGLRGRVVRLLGVNSWRGPWRPEPGVEVDFHAVRILYEVAIVGGTLRHESGGSSDRAEWFPLEGVAGIDHVELVEIGLGMVGRSDLTVD
jgi:ADP-ribose pyrophosphatase YjhB (NUDIX family)